MVTTKWGVPIISNPIVPRGEFFLLGDIDEPIYASRDERRILVHPTTHLRLTYPRSPLWSTKTLGHREAARDHRKYA